MKRKKKCERSRWVDENWCEMENYAVELIEKRSKRDSMNNVRFSISFVRGRMDISANLKSQTILIALQIFAIQLILFMYSCK